MKKIVLLLGVIICAVSCQKSQIGMNANESKVIVTVYDQNGEVAPNVTVKMYDEKDYADFEKNNLTPPTTVDKTNENGFATFVFSREQWFKSQSQRLFAFVVQQGGGKHNYKIWSLRKTVNSGKTLNLEIHLSKSI